MDDLSPFRFEWNEGPIHRLHPLSKLATLLLASFAAMSAGPLPLACVAAAALACLPVAGARARDVARNARFLLPLSFFIVLVRVVEPGGETLFRPAELLPATIQVSRLATVFLLAELFFRSTSAFDIAWASTLAARRLLRRDDIDPGLYVSLVLDFIPRSFDRYARTREAALARGYGQGRALAHARGGGRRSGLRTALRATLSALRSTLAILEAFTASSLRSALRSAAALEARSYDPRRTLGGRPLGGADFAPPLVAALLLASILALG